jgi:hypothetical protein
MTHRVKFDSSRRETWFKIVEGGSTQREANEVVGVSHKTIDYWRKKGREASEGEYHEFVQRLDAVPKRSRRRSANEVAASVRNVEYDGSPEALERLLVRFAHEDRSVAAIRLLNDIRRQRAEQDTEPVKQKTSSLDRLDELARLRSRKVGT